MFTLFVARPRVSEPTLFGGATGLKFVKSTAEANESAPAGDWITKSAAPLKTVAVKVGLNRLIVTELLELNVADPSEFLVVGFVIDPLTVTVPLPPPIVEADEPATKSSAASDPVFAVSAMFPDVEVTEVP
jgi:hypothetical protein